jgi:cysteine desulfurase
MMHLDVAGIAVSAGSACSAGKIDPSHVLDAMKVAPDVAKTALRISFGWNSKPEDVDAFVEVWGKMTGGSDHSPDRCIKS